MLRHARVFIGSIDEKHAMRHFQHDAERTSSQHRSHDNSFAVLCYTSNFSTSTIFPALKPDNVPFIEWIDIFLAAQQKKLQAAKFITPYLAKSRNIIDRAPRQQLLHKHSMGGIQVRHAERLPESCKIIFGGIAQEYSNRSSATKRTKITPTARYDGHRTAT